MHNPVRWIDPLGLAVTTWDRTYVSTASQRQLHANSNAWHATNDAAERARLAAASRTIRESYANRFFAAGSVTFLGDGSVKVNHTSRYNALIPGQGLSVSTSINYTIHYTQRSRATPGGRSVTLNSFSIITNNDPSQFQITGMSGIYGVQSLSLRGNNNTGSFDGLNGVALTGGHRGYAHRVNLPPGVYFGGATVGVTLAISFRDVNANTNNTLNIRHHIYSQETEINGILIQPTPSLMEAFEMGLSAWLGEGRTPAHRQPIRR